MNVIFFFLALVFAALLFVDLLRRGSVRGESHNGASMKWRLGSHRQTEIISNRRLGVLQTHVDDGGELVAGDQIVVWAREFLDDDVLYDVVKHNITNGIAYFYVLDRGHTDRFVTLLSKLYNDVHERRIVDEAINVVFVRGELTLNNFVILAYGTERQSAFSALIYGERPFGWLRQDAGRALLMVSKIKTLVASVAFAQAGLADGARLDYISAEDQIMDFSNLARQLSAHGAKTPDALYFDLKHVIATVDIPSNSEEKVIKLATRIRRERANVP